jgi:hypothetical protein
LLLDKGLPANELAKLATAQQIAAQQIVSKQGLAYGAVRSVEDAFSTLNGPAKLQKAVAWIATEARKQGINITPDEIAWLSN